MGGLSILGRSFKRIRHHGSHVLPGIGVQKQRLKKRRRKQFCVVIVSTCIQQEESSAYK
jgi:hypothetical protein